MRRGLELMAIVVFAAGSVFVHGQQDVEGSKDHPSIQRYPGFYISDYEYRDFKGHDFLVGEETKRVEGKSWEFTYELKEGEKPPSQLEVVRNYENAFKKRGGKVLYEQPDNGVAVVMMPSGAGQLWLDVDVREEGGRIYLCAIATAVMEQKIEVSADDMAKALAGSGHVALHGILFDIGKSEIKPESAGLLEEIAKLLKSDESLSLRIEGHTDNVGQKAANLELSRRRAEAVKSSLVDGGIDAARLTTGGLGDEKPVADNSTASGRVQNRRVELVKR